MQKTKRLISALVVAVACSTPAMAEFMEVVGIAEGDTLNVRSGPGTQHADIGDLQEHEFIQVLGFDATRKWAQIRYRGQLAWVASKHLAPGMDTNGVAANLGAHVVTGIKPGDPDGGLVVRAGDGTGYASIGVLANGTEVHVIQLSTDNKWAMIAFGPNVGWVSRSYLNAVGQMPSPTPQPTPMPAADPNTAPDGLPLPAVFRVHGVAQNDVLNIRAEPAGHAPIIHMVANDIPLAVLGMATANWARVQLQDTVGYAHIRFLKRGGGTTDSNGFQLGLNCIGTEPFWNMQFNTNGTVDYSIAGQTAAPVPLIATGAAASSTGYPFTFNAAPYWGQINTEICSDGMSDNLYPMSIMITAPNEIGTSMNANGCCRLQ